MRQLHDAMHNRRAARTGWHFIYHYSRREYLAGRPPGFTGGTKGSRIFRHSRPVRSAWVDWGCRLRQRLAASDVAGAERDVPRCAGHEEQRVAAAAFLLGTGTRQKRANRLAALDDASHWQSAQRWERWRHQRPRVYDWARVGDVQFFRRNRARATGCWLGAASPSSGELSYYVCFGLEGTTLEELVRIAGARWSAQIRGINCSAHAPSGGPGGIYSLPCYADCLLSLPDPFRPEPSVKRRLTF